MNKKVLILTAVMTLTSTLSVNAADIPLESAPKGATVESVAITQSLMGYILDEVQNGMGYAEARAKSNNIIFNAVINNQTCGYGFGILSAIADNAIFEYRDMYLRPDFYIQAEKKVKILIADIINEVENGTTDYETVEKKSRERIYQSVNPSFNFDGQLALDTCYRDIPSIDSVYFNRTRKLLQNAVSRAEQNTQ